MELSQIFFTLPVQPKCFYAAIDRIQLPHLIVCPVKSITLTNLVGFFFIADDIFMYRLSKEIVFFYAAYLFLNVKLNSANLIL